MRSKRVGIIALLHESNTFIKQSTTLEHFRENTLLRGESVRERLADTHHEVGGFFEGLSREQVEAVPIFAARAVPYGAITPDAFDELLAMMFESLEAAGEIDVERAKAAKDRAVAAGADDPDEISAIRRADTRIDVAMRGTAGALRH